MSEYFVGTIGANNQTTFESLTSSEVKDDLQLNTTHSPTFGGLTVQGGSANIILKDTTDNDDHSIQFVNNLGVTDYQIRTSDPNGSGGDGFYLGSDNGTEVGIYSNGTTALTLDASQNATFAGTVATSEITTASGTLTLNPAGTFINLPNGKKLYGANIGFGYQTNAVSAIKFLLGASIDNPDMRIERVSSNLLIQNEVDDGDILFKGRDGGSTITALTLDMSAGGNATFAGSVTATSLIKSGGTSSQFLKADGSVDGNTYATQSYVSTQVSNLVDSAPAALDTLNELANALGDDASFSTTMSTSLGNRLRVDTASQGLSSTQKSNARTNLGLGTAATSASSAFAPAAGSTSLTTVGTIGTGTWQGSVIASAYLDSDTAHLSGTQTFSGAKTFGNITSSAGYKAEISESSDADNITSNNIKYGYLTNAASNKPVTGNSQYASVGNITLTHYDAASVDDFYIRAKSYNGNTSWAKIFTDQNSAFAPLASPALTGNPTAPTQVSSENSTKIATTAYVKSQGYITSANGGNAATLDGIDSTSFLRSDANDTMSGTLTFSGASSHIALQEDHVVFKRFDVTVDEGVTNSTTAYLLLCRNAPYNDVNGTVTMDRTSGLRHACSVDIVVSAGTGTNPAGTCRSIGTAGASSPSYELVTLTYSSNSFIALKITNPDAYYETTGHYFTGRLATTDTTNALQMIAPASVSSVSSFDSNPSHQINGNSVFHDGYHPNADILTTTRNIALSGDVTGNVNFNGSSNVSITTSLALDSVGENEIAAGAVGASELKVSGNGSNTQFLRSDGDGTFTWATPTDTNTFRPITAGGNTLGSGETLAFTAGSNVTITESAGAVTITAANDNTQLSTAQVRSKISGTGLISYNSSTGVISTTANNYSLPEATATVRGGIELFSNTDQSVAANSVSATAGRTYGIQLNSAGQAVVNVPWSDTNTDTNTFRTVTAGGNTLGSGETLALTAGSNVSISEAGGQVTISSTDTNTVYSHPTHNGDDINIDTGALTGATVISDLDFNITTNSLGHVTDANGTVATRTLTAANLGISAPNAPASASAAIVGNTVEVTFAESTTSNIDAYLVYSSIDGSDYGLISIVPPDDFAASMSIIDNSFDETGTQAYRVYAVKYGILSSATTASVSYTVSSAEPTTMSVVNLNNAYYVQWNPPSSNARFVTAYNVYKHEHATQSSLSRSSASLIYSGMNTNYMYQISGTNNNNFHQFWVETTIA